MTTHLLQDMRKAFNEKYSNKYPRPDFSTCFMDSRVFETYKTLVKSLVQKIYRSGDGEETLVDDEEYGYCFKGIRIIPQDNLPVPFKFV